jgi:hypothetical protein
LGKIFESGSCSAHLRNFLFLDFKERIRNLSFVLNKKKEMKTPLFAQNRFILIEKSRTFLLFKKNNDVKTPFCAEQSILVVDLLSSDDEQPSEDETEELGDFLLHPADASEVGSIHPDIS